MKWYWVAALCAFASLSAMAVWMGGLNQDEGWYLYAANLVADGKLPYRDFFYTQGPLLPIVYSFFTWIWKSAGILGGRVFTLMLGMAGIGLAVAWVRRLVSGEKRNFAALAVFLLLGNNLYHLYYLAIPKTYALAGLLVITGFYLLSFSRLSTALFAGVALAFAAGARISLGALLAVVGLALLFRRSWRQLFGLVIGGTLGLLLVYGPFLFDASALNGLIQAQRYHAARGGADIVWTVGSLSRLVRWYLPLMVIAGYVLLSPRDARQREPLAVGSRLAIAGFLAVFAVQIVAPFPYEDYQVPVMAPLTVGVVAALARKLELKTTKAALLVLGLAWGTAFGNPLLEKWTTNGQDRFWSLKKSEGELGQLRRVAGEIEALDPQGEELLTQDLYLAIETNRKVPAGLEMGPFAMLSDAEWRQLLKSASCKVAALSGYSFAIEPPVCAERPINEQLEYWDLLREHYEVAGKEPAFGQNATTLIILKRK